ncbi:MAG: DUF2231 domain-containing protein [Ignavibacteria bacterium]|nr:DUF2231 domain-containing protein [Ignavibacteria bacterium]
MFDISHLHPMIVHFPIALLIVGFLAEVVGLVLKKEFFTKAAFYLLILGTLGVVSAYITGNIAGDGVSETGQLKNALETHEQAAQLTLWLMVGAAIVRIALVWMKKFDGILKYVAFVLFLAGVLSVARTGFYGGELVYKHAAGVQFNFGLDLNSNDAGATTDKNDDN